MTPVRNMSGGDLDGVSMRLPPTLVRLTGRIPDALPKSSYEMLRLLQEVPAVALLVDHGIPIQHLHIW